MKKTGRIVLKTILILLSVLIVIVILLLTPPVQNFVKDKAQNWLSKKLDTKVEIGRLHIGIPNTVTLASLYIEDKNKDTLLYSGELQVNMDMWRLLKSELLIYDIGLSNLTANVTRTLPDTAFNFQFIIDAFASKDTVTSTDTSSFKMNFRHIVLDNVRLRYLDTITGNDMRVAFAKLDTRIDVFDPAHSVFDVPVTELNGLRAYVYQRKPLVTPEPEAVDKAEAKEPSTFTLNIGKIALNNCFADYGNDASAFYTTLDLGKLAVNADLFDLSNRRIDLSKLQLHNTNAQVRLGKSPAAKVVEKEVEQEVDAQADAGWTIRVANIDLDKNDIKFDNDNSPRQPEGMDYGHLDVKQLSLGVKDLHFRTDSISGEITRGSMREKNFQLNQLQTAFLYTDQQAFLHDLLLETPGTRLERDIAIRYPSLQSLSNNIGLLEIEMDIRNSKVLVADILTFAPMLRNMPGFANPRASFVLTGDMSGPVSNLRMDALQLRGLKATRVDLSGRLKGLPDIKKTQGNLSIKELSTTSADLLSILPPGTLPANITLPSSMRLKGTVGGNYQQFVFNLALATTLGNATVKGKVSEPMDSLRIGYDVVVSTQSLDLKTLLKQPDLGPVSLELTAKGRGIVPDKMNATIKGTVQQAMLKGYNYTNLTLDGGIAQQQFTLKAAIQNEPIHVTVDASGNLAGQYPSAKFDINIDSIKTQPMGLTTENIVYHGHIKGDFQSTNPDSLEGQLNITKSLLIKGNDRFQLDTIQLLAANTDTGQSLSLTTEVLSARLYGRYKLTEAGNVFTKTIDPYFNITPDSVIVDSSYDFRVQVHVHNPKKLQDLVPDIKRLDTVKLDGHFSGNGDLQASLLAPVVIYGANEIHGLQLITDNNNNQLSINTALERVNVGGSLAIYKPTLNARIADNKIDFALDTKNRTGQTIYHLAGLFSQPQRNEYSFSLKPDSLILDSTAWTIAANNRIDIKPDSLTADNFILEQKGQKLAIQTIRNQEGLPLGIDFTNFRISTILGFVNSDSLKIDGGIDGNVTLRELMKSPTFVADLNINDLNFNRDTLGNIAVKVSNPQANRFDADIALTGRGNDLTIKGNYLAADSNSAMDLKLNIAALQLNTLEGVSMGNIKQATGTITGAFDIKGTPARPSVNGDLNFNKTRFIPSIMNSFVAIDGQKIAVNNEGISFNNFTITDSINNKAVLDGNVYTSTFSTFRFDLHFNADNFQALNTTKKDNNLYFGRLFFDSRLNIKGTELRPSVDGTLKINDKTNLTVILPQEDPSVEQRDGIVRFVDRDNQELDSLFLTAYDSLNTVTVRDFDINVNLTIVEEAEFNLIIDEGNGDLLKVKGEANLNAGVDPSGKITLTGNYELKEGSYDLNVNFLKRKFLIQEGSKITWQGEPTEADVDLTAMYIANTAPIDLVEKQLSGETSTERNTYRQKLPFEVHLIMKGQLLKPTITFDIQLPDDKNYGVSKDIVETSNNRLTELRQEPSEMNKQVFALLLLGHFMGDNPFASGNSSLTAESFARQSVSKLLTEQLNNLASNLIEGVNIDFDLATSDDYTTGERRNRTDLNVAVSKQLLNDRLTVTVGSNFALENPNANQQANNLAENIQLAYRLSKDGRYQLRAYRKNEFEGILEGYIIETGVGFIITLDYNRFRDIFISKKQRDRMRTIRREQRQTERDIQNAKEKASGTPPPENQKN
ncbi:MAG: translocation/assembly module TamB [Candidatus Pseudobacter hemicellulosilyticus]|uniref:Translocation/assembly module TamB n=1 Tax=Candidatus Pseudobacter hemicellulosilyticus TaxID=3121375 RepID=A0AAJ5WLW8_9BACT|nr:MAG: translocation/assembly module TamB [Pseudobacter sp.]